MNMEILRDALLWCTVINYGIVLYWFLALLIMGDWMFKMHGKWFNLTRERFDAIHYGGLVMYKVAVVFLNLVPYVVLRFIV